MLKAISIVPIFASFLAALAYQTEHEQPRSAATPVQLVAAHAVAVVNPLAIRASAAADTQWSDVYEVLESEVADPDARERLGVLIGKLETLAYAGDAGVADFNALLEATIDEFWILTEEDGLLSYGERDLVFDVLMDAIASFPMADDTVIWEKDAATLSKAKCKNKTECDVADDDKRTCTRMREMKRQPDGTYKETGKFRCESGSLR
ncbi:MAG: hypothetical protein IT453_13870 [Planctomycetes bacterium]|nr:hypothetical protein [Planctomycetota bacterium]